MRSSLRQAELPSDTAWEAHNFIAQTCSWPGILQARLSSSASGDRISTPSNWSAEGFNSLSYIGLAACCEIPNGCEKGN